MIIQVNTAFQEACIVQLMSLPFSFRFDNKNMLKLKHKKSEFQ